MALTKTKLTKEKLEEILTQKLGLAAPTFHLEKVGGQLVGDLISPTFKGKRDHERQKLIWDALDAELGAESVVLVGMLLAYTPDEWKLGDDGRPVAAKKKKAG
jgi:acid stress-induced BolA-like protein IbaG/YrbA